MAEAVSDFAAKWSLDSPAIDFLGGLDEAAVNIIIAEFGPRGDTQNVTSKLYAFARSVTSRLSTPGQVGPDLETFTKKWDIDAAGVAWLYSLAPKVTEVLVQEFDPKEDVQNVMGKLKCFARSIQQRQDMQVSHGNGRYPSVSVDTSGPWHRANEFCTYWGIEETAMQVLHSLPPDTQAAVIADFDPKGDTHNITGKFMAFARSVAGGGKASGKGYEVVNSFATYWGLDESTAAFVRDLPEETRSTVIQEFDPKAGTNNINGKIRMFAKGILARPSQTFAHTEASAGWGASTGGLDKSASGPDATLAVVDEEATALAAASTSDPAIYTFVLRWHLDQSSVSLLEGLSESVRETVLAEFDPRGEIRNMGAKLAAFARTVQSGKGKGGKGSAGGLDGQSSTSTSPSQLSYAAPARHAPSGAAWAGASSAAEPSQEEEDAFLLKWELQDNQQAKDVLKRLHGHVRGRVMREFLPGEGTTNPFGKFCGFANSVAKAAAREAWPPTASQGYGAGYGAAAPNYRGYSGAGGSAPAGYGGNAWGNARSTSSAAQFAEQWQLDEGSQAILYGLAPDVQAIVIAEFQPRGDTANIAGKFCGFARSVATRGRGEKRPWPGGGPTQPTWR